MVQNRGMGRVYVLKVERAGVAVENLKRHIIRQHQSNFSTYKAKFLSVNINLSQIGD